MFLRDIVACLASPLGLIFCRYLFYISMEKRHLYCNRLCPSLSKQMWQRRRRSDDLWPGGYGFLAITWISSYWCLVGNFREWSTITINNHSPIPIHSQLSTAPRFQYSLVVWVLLSNRHHQWGWKLGENSNIELLGYRPHSWTTAQLLSNMWVQAKINDFQPWINKPQALNLRYQITTILGEYHGFI